MNVKLTKYQNLRPGPKHTGTLVKAEAKVQRWPSLWVGLTTGNQGAGNTLSEVTSLGPGSEVLRHSGSEQHCPAHL
jgi:hypothetical protein